MYIKTIKYWEFDSQPSSIWIFVSDILCGKPAGAYQWTNRIKIGSLIFNISKDGLQAFLAILKTGWMIQGKITMQVSPSNKLPSGNFTGKTEGLPGTV